MGGHAAKTVMGLQELIVKNNGSCPNGMLLRKVQLGTKSSCSFDSLFERGEAPPDSKPDMSTYLSRYCTLL